MRILRSVVGPPGWQQREIPPHPWAGMGAWGGGVSHSAHPLCSEGKDWFPLPSPAAALSRAFDAGSHRKRLPGPKGKETWWKRHARSLRALAGGGVCSKWLSCPGLTFAGRARPVALGGHERSLRPPLLPPQGTPRLPPALHGAVWLTQCGKAPRDAEQLFPPILYKAHASSCPSE